MLFIIACTKQTTTVPTKITTPIVNTNKLDLNKLCNKMWTAKEFTNFNNFSVTNPIWYGWGSAATVSRIYHSSSNTITTYHISGNHTFYFKILNDTTMSMVSTTDDTTNVTLWFKEYLSLSGDSNLYLWQVTSTQRQLTHYKL